MPAAAYFSGFLMLAAAAARLRIQYATSRTGWADYSAAAAWPLPGGQSSATRLPLIRARPAARLTIPLSPLATADFAAATRLPRDG